MSAYTDAEQFLQAVFGSDFGTRAIFANLHPAVHTRELQQLDIQRDCYWSIASFPPDYEGTNVEDKALDVRALVIDDVGTKGPSEGAVLIALGEPTAITLTSAGNYQWAYRLSKPVSKDDWAGFFGGIEALIAHNKPLEARAAQTLMRLPMGRNTKPQNNGFAVRLVKLNPDREIDPDTIIRVKVARPGPLSKDAPKRVHNIKAMLAILPNDLEYDPWIDVGQRALALAVDTEDCHEAWHEFSSRTTLKVYDYDYSEARWVSFTADRTNGGLLIDAVQKIGGAAVDAWWQSEAPYVFDDGVIHPEAPKRKGITATPFKWRDPASFPLRDWLYGKLLIRKFISMTVAPGGVGKSSLVATEALAQVTERNLLGDKPSKPLRVWIWNLEDPLEETERKIQTAALHYGISEADIGDRLFVDSGRQQKLVIARMRGRDGAMIMQPVVDALVAEIKRRGVDIVVVDPFVSCHEVPENDNTAQDMIVKEWGAVAERGNCAVHLLDHTRKAPSGTEVETESSRGAKAKTDAARVVRVINRMTDAVGKSHGISDPWQYFNTFHDKSNMAPPVNHRPWFHLESVNMGNGGVMDGIGAAQPAGESVGVVVQWTPPSASDVVTSENFKKAATVLGNKLWRMDSRSPNWWGFAVAPVLEIDAIKEQGKKQLDALVKAWLNAGVAQEVKAFDERRRPKQFMQITGGF